jgi:hypothetical protein
VLVPIPVLFYIYGPKLRAKSHFSPKMMMKPLPTDDSESESEEPQMVAIMATRSRADVPNGSTVPEPSGANVGEKEKEG